MSDENRNKLNGERKKIEELKDCMERMGNKKIKHQNKNNDERKI